MENKTVSYNRLVRSIFRSDNIMIGYIALFTIVLHLIAIEGFGYFRDELYYISCSNHLAFGFVDQPPLSIILIKIIRLLFGDSLFALRILPVLSSGLIVYGAGLMAKEFGGRRFAMVLASFSTMASIGNFFIFSYYSMNFLDHLFWMLLIFIVIRIIKKGNLKLWLLFGVVAGLGLQNKISVLFLGFGIAIGLILTEERKQLKSLYIWAGAIIAGLIFLPYVIWNMANDWPLMEFINNARMYKMTSVSPIDFLKEQILNQNPASFLIWIAGIWFFLFNKKGKKYRIFGWVYLSIYILFTIQQAKAYYLAPVYPLLFAGGAVITGNLLEKLKKRRIAYILKHFMIIMILISTLALAPLTLPILSQKGTISWYNTLGIEGGSGENHKKGVLPQHFADMHGWPEIAKKVSEVFNSLSNEEKLSCLIYAQNYGETGAINFFGKKYNLPEAVSGHNNHYFWPPKMNKIKVLIIVGGRRSSHLSTFEEVEEAGRISHSYAMPYENNIPVFVCKKPRFAAMHEIWQKVKHFD